MRSVRVLVLAALAVGSGSSLIAQCGVSNFGPSIGNGDDAVLPMQSLGFAFPFNGTTYTDVHVSTNGLVYLSNGGIPAPGGAGCCAGSTATLVAGSPIIAPMWSDHVITGSGTVHFNALPGKAAVTWENAVEYPSSATSPQYTFQLQLLATGEIFCTYDARCVVATAGDCLVGMSEGGSAVVPAASDFSTPSTSTTTTNFEIFNNTTLPFDLAGQAVQFIPAGVGYVWVPQPCTSGANVSYGSGCYRLMTSMYENFPTNAIDLANSGMSMLFSGTGYTVLPGLTTYVAPSGSATSLALGDDTQTTVALSAPFPYSGGTTNTLSVCSNGYISVSASGNGTGFTPTVATMLNAANTGFWNWHDMNPAATGSGQVKFEEVAGVAYITWDGVYSFGTTNPETFQFQLELATGNVHYVWGAVGGFGTTGYLVAYSPGGPSPDLGSIDLSALLPGTLSIGSIDLAPLALSASPVPSPGATMVYTTSNMPEYAPTSGIFIGLNILSLAQTPAPGVDLGFIGAPGCAAHVQSLDLTQAMVGASNSQTVSFPLPATLPVGFQIFSQSIALILPNSLPNGQNAFGMTTSNGVASTVGNW